MPRKSSKSKAPPVHVPNPATHAEVFPSYDELLTRAEIDAIADALPEDDPISGKVEELREQYERACEALLDYQNELAEIEKKKARISEPAEALHEAASELLHDLDIGDPSNPSATEMFVLRVGIERLRNATLDFTRARE